MVVNSSKELSERFKKIAEEDGLEVITIEAPFVSDDVPKYLDGLRRFEYESRKNAGKYVIG